MDFLDGSLDGFLDGILDRYLDGFLDGYWTALPTMSLGRNFCRHSTLFFLVFSAVSKIHI